MIDSAKTVSRARHYNPQPVKKRGMSTAAKVTMVTVGSLLLVVGIVYVAGVFAFQFLFMPNTALDGRDVSWKLASDVSSSYASKVGTYQVQVTGGGLSFTVRASDIGLSFDEGAYERGTIGQQEPFLWPLEIASSHQLEAQSGATFDGDKLRSLIEQQVSALNANATAPTNATIGFDEGSQQYVVVAEKPGSQLDLDRVVAAVSDQIGALPASIVLDDSVYAKPEVTKEDESLAAAAQNANRFMSADIPLTLGGKSAGEITRTQISQWITLGDDHTATLDQQKLAAWVKDNVAAKFDTVAHTRTYTRADGKQITVEDSGHGNYGWVTDEAALVSTLTQAIEDGSTQTVDIPTKQTANTVPDAGFRDWGNRYIDIDLTEQHVRMYGDDGSVIWESDAVTGNVAQSHDTPTGVYAMNDYRASDNVELRGKIDPKTNEPEYISHVNYWMPFIDNSWALHDADWRSSFGGNIYKTNGSHGCVNLPPDKAAELYKLCKIGDVVVVHY